MVNVGVWKSAMINTKSAQCTHPFSASHKNKIVIVPKPLISFWMKN